MAKSGSIEISTEALREGIKALDRIPVHSAILSSQFAKLTLGAGKLRCQLAGLAAGDCTCSVAGPTVEAVFYLDRRVLSALLNATSSAKLQLTMKDGNWTFRTGRHRLDATAVDTVSGYQMPGPKARAKLANLSFRKEDVTALHTAAVYAPQTLAADNMACVYLKQGLGMVASDSHSVFFHSMPKVRTSLPLPLLLCAAMEPADVVQADTRGMLLEHSNDNAQARLYQTVSARASKEFPIKALARHLRQTAKAPTLLRLPAAQFQSAVATLKSFIFGADDTALLLIAAKPGDTAVTFSLASVQGKAQETLRLKPAPKVEVNLRLLISRLVPWLAYIPKDAEVELAFAEHVNVLRCAKGREILLQAEVAE